jgi:hypothetical protein
MTYPRSHHYVFLRTFGWSLAVTAVVGYFSAGLQAVFLVAILGILEISLGLDNAVVNPRILERMSAFWQKIFLTVGILIAVLGMRIFFPLPIMGIPVQINPSEAVQPALPQGSIDARGAYAYLLGDAYPLIATFGGVFLLMSVLDFYCERRSNHWLSFIEGPLPRSDRRVVLIRRRNRGVRDHVRPDPHRTWSRPHRRHLRAVRIGH